MKMKALLLKLPEYYFIILVVLSGYSQPFEFNPILIGIAVIVILQIIFKNRILGFMLGALFFLINLYFLGALFSEFNEFLILSNKAMLLLFVGLSIWILNAVFSLVMIYKCLTISSNQKPKMV